MLPRETLQKRYKIVEKATEVGETGRLLMRL
jgi:hypothetical protein